MKIIDRRLRKLEHRFGTGEGKPQLLLVACRAGSQHDIDWQIEILDECGFLRTRRGGDADVSPGRRRVAPRSPEPNPRGLRTSMVEHKIATDITR